MFKYLYYRIFTFYRDVWGVKTIPGIYAISIISISLTYDVYTVSLLIYPDYHFPDSRTLSFYIWACLFIIFVALLSYAPINKLEERFGKESQEKRILKGWLIVLYVTISFFSLFISAYYVHGLRMQLF